VARVLRQAQATPQPTPATDHSTDLTATTGTSAMKALVYLGPTGKALIKRPKPEFSAAASAIAEINRTTIHATALHDIWGQG
jgi:hypothetical protein